MIYNVFYQCCEHCAYRFRKKNVIDGRKQDSIKWECMVLKGIYVNANIYPLIFTPPRNHGGVIFSLQFVCLSACEQNSNQTDALISTQLWLINLHFLTLPVLLGKFQAIDWRPVLGVVIITCLPNVTEIEDWLRPYGLYGP